MKKLIAANWKMNKTIEEGLEFVWELKRLLKNENMADVAICPPFTCLHAMSKALVKSNFALGAQNMHFEGEGAYTGEISPNMLKDIGCEYVILGHSERREIFGEDDYLVNRKVIAALNHPLNPILCIGENLEQKNQGKTDQVLKSQLNNCLKDINSSQILKINIAYEPVWAISKGNPNHKSAAPEDAEQAHIYIREILSNKYGKAIAQSVRIIYGGSVKPEYAKELLSMPNIDGGLVGKASLNAKSFAEIVKSIK